MRDPDHLLKLYPDSAAARDVMAGRELRRFLAAYLCSLAVAGAVLLVIVKVLP